MYIFASTDSNNAMAVLVYARREDAVARARTYMKAHAAYSWTRSEPSPVNYSADGFSFYGFDNVGVGPNRRVTVTRVDEVIE